MAGDGSPTVQSRRQDDFAQSGMTIADHFPSGDENMSCGWNPSAASQLNGAADKPRVNRAAIVHGER